MMDSCTSSKQGYQAGLNRFVKDNFDINDFCGSSTHNKNDNKTTKQTSNAVECWICPICTFHNINGNASVCGICEHVLTEHVQTYETDSVSIWQCFHCQCHNIDKYIFDDVIRCSFCGQSSYSSPGKSANAPNEMMTPQKSLNDTIITDDDNEGKSDDDNVHDLQLESVISSGSYTIKPYQWQCALCTVFNHNDLCRCHLCGHIKDHEANDKEREDELHSTGNIQWECGRCSLLNHIDLPYCEMCQLSKHYDVNHLEQWQCKICNMSNYIEMPYCEQCYCRREDVLNAYDDNKDEKKQDVISNNVECDRLNAATKSHQKRQDLQSLTSLMALLFEQNVENYKKQNLQNLFRYDAIKDLRILLDTLLNKDGLSEYVDEEEVQQTIDILIKYWKLFAHSKRSITSKREHIVVLLDLLDKWHAILTQRNEDTLNKQQVNDMHRIGKGFSKWFEYESEMKHNSQKWNELLTELQQQEAFWKQKTVEIKEDIEKKQSELEDKQKSFWAQCFGFIANLIHGASRLAESVIGFVFGGCSAAAIVRNVFNPAAEYCEDRAFISKKFQDKKKQFDQLNANAIIIEETFHKMTTNSLKMDQFFSDFIDCLKSPKKKMNKIEKQMRREEFSLDVIELNVSLMIQSFNELLEIFDNIIKEIDARSKILPNQYTTPKGIIDE